MSIDQIISYIWTPSLNLKKETIKNWSRLQTYITENGERYLHSRINNSKKGKLKKVTSFKKSGDIESIIQMEYPDVNTEVTIVLARGEEQSRDIKKFNEHGLLIEEIASYPFCGSDHTYYQYDDQNRLLKIFQKEDDGEKWEDFIYKDDKLFKIETHTSDGGFLFRGFMYYENGLLEKMIRMQNDFVNMEQKHIYNEKGQHIREIHESIKRAGEGKNSLMITERTYHPNGQMASEVFKTIDSYKGLPKFEGTDFYNEDGLLIRSEEHDYLKDKKECTEYDYEYRFLNEIL